MKSSYQTPISEKPYQFLVAAVPSTYAMRSQTIVNNLLKQVKNNETPLKEKEPLADVWIDLEDLAKRVKSAEGKLDCVGSLAAIENAKSWLRRFYTEVVDIEEEWFPPHVTSGAEGEVVLEWWKNDNKLTFFINSSEPFYLKSFGPNVITEMQDGPLHIGTDLMSLWASLKG